MRIRRTSNVEWKSELFSFQTATPGVNSTCDVHGTRRDGISRLQKFTIPTAGPRNTIFRAGDTIREVDILSEFSLEIRYLWLGGKWPSFGLFPVGVFFTAKSLGRDCGSFFYIDKFRARKIEVHPIDRISKDISRKIESHKIELDRSRPIRSKSQKIEIPKDRIPKDRTRKIESFGIRSFVIRSFGILILLWFDFWDFDLLGFDLSGFRSYEIRSFAISIFWDFDRMEFCLSCSILWDSIFWVSILWGRPEKFCRNYFRGRAWFDVPSMHTRGECKVGLWWRTIFILLRARRTTYFLSCVEILSYVAMK